MPTESPDWRNSRGAGALAAVAYMVLSLSWMLFIGIATAVGLIGWAFVTGADPTLLVGSNDIASILSTSVIAATTLVQFVGMLGIAVAEVAVLRWDWRRSFAIARPAVVPLVAGAVGGLLVGVFPGWIAEYLMNHFPFLNGGNLEAINGLLANGPLIGRIGMIIAVCVGAPLVEELVFRGFLFDAMRRTTNPIIAWLASSLLFALYHVDPIHVVSVLFTGLFLGWLRLVSGSVWPGVVAHAANNSLAAGVAVAFGAETASQTDLPWWGAVGAALVTIAIAAGVKFAAAEPGVAAER